ncbi:hypothetical protein BDK51DRAFT_50737 [Blyttiomyces helicus]|uniref:GAR domain-containing protein n=1 Tax=Blyttiomyces helicus TaxID=388810 RepID=A0A4P9W233_9FUNG|nr:hypothetical protein BDK51DRAFT_50737 [Blyttiomyces helicus]|eukprot:RKO84828.1 hypothetical protein BDK51DRAFT_50737 [Blyttiomyces helicus]
MWIAAARNAAEDLAKAQAEEADHETDFDEVAELEDRLTVFGTTIKTFRDLSEGARKPSAASSYSSQTQNALEECVKQKSDCVTRSWDELLETVDGLRGSRKDREKELRFRDACDEISTLLDRVREIIAAADPGSPAEQDLLRSAEDLLHTEAWPRAIALRQCAAETASSPSVLARYLETQRQIQDQIWEAFDEVEDRRTSVDRETLLKRFETGCARFDLLVEEVSRVVADAAAAVTAASAAAVGVPGGKAPPTDSECEAIALDLDTRFALTSRRVEPLLERIEGVARRVGDGARPVEMAARWKGIVAWKDGVKEELLKRTKARRTVKKSALPTMVRSRTIALATPSSTPPTTPQRSALTIPPPPYPSPTSSPTPSPTPPSRGPVRVYLPSNRYVPTNPHDALDVQIARIVNASPASVRVQPIPGEPGRYRFGEALPRLCFCRLLRDQQVMVRIGGGYQELGAFLVEHATLEHRIPTIRSFGAGEQAGEEHRGTVVELAPGSADPYVLATKKPKQFASAIMASARKDRNAD